MQIGSGTHLFDFMDKKVSSLDPPEVLADPPAPSVGLEEVSWDASGSKSPSDHPLTGTTTSPTLSYAFPTEQQPPRRTLSSSTHTPTAPCRLLEPRTTLSE